MRRLAGSYAAPPIWGEPNGRCSRQVAYGLTDHAAAFNFSPPFAVGTWDWVIPNNFRRAATTGAGTFFFNTLQTFRIDAAGSITVSKQGATVTKPPAP